uniref:DNA polymerase n=3 Tax=Mesocestoides corti TaxID=53468 RepID=A0A5K3EIL2_MESCO
MPAVPAPKRSRREQLRKSLPEKKAMQPRTAFHPHHDTHATKSPLSSTNPYSLKARRRETAPLKKTHVEPGLIDATGLEPETKPYVEVKGLDAETVCSAEDPPLEYPHSDFRTSAATTWLSEEGDDTPANQIDVNYSITSCGGGSEGLQFFWVDAYEDLKSHQGVIFLFGKVPCKDDPSSFNSCCIRIKDLDHRVFFLPDPSKEFTVKDVYEELRELSGQWKIGKFKCKPTTKKYCFEHVDVPSETEYLEVRYSANFPSLPANLSGRTFSRVFGSAASFLENFILDLHLRGPCWLELKGATPLQPQLSWCKVDYDFSFQHPNKIVKLADVLMTRGDLKAPPAPPLRMVSLDVKSVVRKETLSSEIIAVGLLVDNHFHLDKPAEKRTFQSHYLVLAPPKDSVLPYDLSKRLPTWGSQYQPPSSNCSDGVTLSGVDVEPNERALLGRLLTRIHKLDPDLIIGHDLWGNQLDLLVHRLNFHKVAHWHRIGRLRRSAHFAVNFNRAWFVRHALPGRLVCDTRISARELVRSRTYNLSELAYQILGGDVRSRRQIPLAVSNQFSSSLPSDENLDEALISGIDLEVDSADLRCLFTSSSLVKELIDFCLSDSLLVLRLAHQLQIIPLAHQITSICGNVISRTLAGGRSERNDALLLHAFTEQGYLVPDAPRSFVGGKKAARDAPEELDQDGSERVQGRRKPAYAGGLVLEPKIGFYDTYILLLDFNSLYPSIIQEFNLCFTTMERSFFAAKDPDDSNTTDNEDMYISALIASVTQVGDVASVTRDQQHRLPTSQAPGILPSEVRRLVESRKEVKKLIASASGDASLKVAQWNIRQQALKITANSVYGCLGFSASRFCARGLAALVTGLGRALLVNTKELVENMKLDVIYGDTDSIMVNTNSTDLLSALAIGEKVKHDVNKRYRLVELDTDGVFAAMLLLAKKKYAALSITRPFEYAEVLRARPELALQPPPAKAEFKGLDIVRRDWCRLAAEVGKFCVNTLLSGRNSSEKVVEQIHEHLRAVARQVREGSLPKTDFVITKMLTKNPEDYPDAKSQPHVQVALRFNQQVGADGGHRFRAGDTVEYVICDDGTNRSSVQRAYSPAELTGTVQVVKKVEEGEQNPSPCVGLAIDVHYYLANQIHPVVSRLVAPIEGTSPAHIADCLGLDSASYRRTMAAAASAGDEHGLGEANDGFMFSGNFLNDADPLQIVCPLRYVEAKKCSGKAAIRTSPFTQSGLANWVCPECNEGLLNTASHAVAVVNQLVLQAREHITAYECGVMMCEDPACALPTRALFCPPSGGGSEACLWTAAGHPLCPACGSGHSILRTKYSEIQLYRQLIFYRHLLEDFKLDDKKNLNDMPSNLSPAVRDILDSGLKHIRRFLSQSAFAVVDLGQIFAGLRTTQGTLGSR